MRKPKTRGWRGRCPGSPGHIAMMGAGLYLHCKAALGSSWFSAQLVPGGLCLGRIRTYAGPHRGSNLDRSPSPTSAVEIAGWQVALRSLKVWELSSEQQG